MNLPQPLRFILPLLVLIMLPSCGSDFRKAWKRDICPAPPPANGVVGKWEGTWLSAANGHHGKLRCVVGEPKEYMMVSYVPSKNSDAYCFHYHATWMKILSGSYKAFHHVVRNKDGSHTFKGDHQMPDWAGGKYHYEGTIKGDDFNACYESAMDRGTYTMKRVR
jgi:hypothetical protein